MVYMAQYQVNLVDPYLPYQPQKHRVLIKPARPKFPPSLPPSCWGHIHFGDHTYFVLG